MATPVTAPLVGKIVSITIKVGDRVEENDQGGCIRGDEVEMPWVAPSSGIIKEIFVSPGQEVEAQATIAMIE